MATAAKVTTALQERNFPLAGSYASVTFQVSSLQLSSLVERINGVSLAAEKLVAGRSVEDMQWRPEAGSWSVAECLDHIAQTAFAFLPAIQEAIASAPALKANRALRTGILARLFIRNLEPPYRIRLKVLPQIMPRCKNFDSAWSGFQESQSQLLKAVHSANGLAIDRVKVESPVYARLSYNIYGALCILMAHERRHLWQIERTLRALDGRARNLSNSSC
jgi:hypothetical protein